LNSSSTPLISIITPVFNSEIYLSESVNSVLSQTFTDFELILINDASSDRSGELLKQFAESDSRIIIIENEQNSGPAVSRNKGIEKARGEFLAFLDADDLWYPEFLGQMLAFMREKKCVLACASHERVDENLNRKYQPFIVPEKASYEDLLKTCSIPMLTGMLHVKKTGKYYFPDLKVNNDYGFWLKILRDVDFVYGNKKILAKYRMRSGSVSRNKFRSMRYIWKLYREQEGAGLIKSVFWSVRYILNGIKKYSA